ncbi:MAG: hypothetical protein PHP62_00470 [Candidatus Moranbacteria bacterium]|nr:hypothetical protein [Candidatus Moranbacteria bacterium]
MELKIDEIALKREEKRIAKIQKGQQSSNRPIKKFVQLVQQVNDCFLYPSQAIQSSLSTSFSLAEFSNDPTKAIYIKDDGIPLSFLGKNQAGQPRALDFRAVQRINHSFINTEGFCHSWDYIFENLLFDFVNLKDKQELKRFIEKTGFSVFPNFTETSDLLIKYAEAGIEGIPSFRVTNDGTIPVIWNEFKNEERRKIEEINLDFLWLKKEKLLDQVKKYEANELVINNLLYLNEQMENVSDAIMDADAFHKVDIANRSIENQIQDTRNLEQILNEKKVADANLVTYYRIYGHFSACCFELFLKIMEKQEFAVCANMACQRYFKLERKGHEYCGHEECNNQRSAKRTKKSSTKKKN